MQQTAEVPSYLEVRLEANEEWQEVLIALLEAIGYESFVQEENHLLAYATTVVYDERLLQETLASLTEPIAYSIRAMEQQNWNAIWESSYDSVRIGSFCLIRPLFRPAEEGFEHVITIQPEMSFGTGHHATTQMMVEQMQHIDFAGKRVLDIGCGTGVLGILAEKLGAAEVQLVEIDPIAAENARENLLRNQTEHCTVHTGGMEVVPAGVYDVVLANIDRNTLLLLGAELAKHLNDNGILVISGFIAEDAERIIRYFNDLNLTKPQSLSQNNWQCVRFECVLPTSA